MATIKYKNGDTWTQIVAQDVDAVSTTTTATQNVQGYLEFPVTRYPYVKSDTLPAHIAPSTSTSESTLTAFSNVEDNNVVYIAGGYKEPAAGTGEGRLHLDLVASELINGVSTNRHKNYISVWLDPMNSTTTTPVPGYTIAYPAAFRKALGIGRVSWLNNTGSNATISGNGYSTISNISFTGEGLWMLTGHVQFENVSTSAGRLYIGISDTQNYLADAAKGTSSLYAGQTNKSIVLNNMTFLYGSTTAQTYYLTCWVETGVTKVSNYQFSAVCLG